MSVSGWPFTGMEMHEFLSNEVNNFSCSSLFLSLTFLRFWLVLSMQILVIIELQLTPVFLVLVTDHLDHLDDLALEIMFLSN